MLISHGAVYSNQLFNVESAKLMGGGGGGFCPSSYSRKHLFKRALYSG